jgi:hypothetical protein
MNLNSVDRLSHEQQKSSPAKDRSMRTQGVRAVLLGTDGKDDRRPLAALLILAVVLWIPVMRGPIDLRWDAGVYYILGTSIAQGQGYRLLSEPGDPQAVQYPPLLPLLVAAHQRVLGTSNPVVVGKWLRITFGLILLAVVAVTYVLGRRWLSPWQAFTAGVVYLLSRETYFFASLLFAEIPFTLVSLLFFLPRRPSWQKEIGAGACAIATYFLRTIGIALLAAWVAESLIQRQWKRATLRAAVALLPVLLWQGYVNWVTASDTYKHPAYAYQRAPYQNYNVTYSENMKYLDPYRPELGTATLAQKLKRVVRNRTPIVQTFSAMIFWRGLVLAEAPLPGWTVEAGYDVMINSHGWLRRLLNYGVSVFVILGLVTLWRSGERSMTIYLVLSIAIIAATPWPAQFGRYFSPLVPFLAIAFVLGLVWSKRQFGPDEHTGARRLVSAGLAMVAGIWLASTLTAQALDYARRDNQTNCRNRGTGCGDAHYVDASGVEQPYRLFYYDKGWRDFDAALGWLRNYARPGAIVVTSCPQLVNLMLHFKSVMPPMESNVDAAQRLLDDVPVTFLIVDDLDFVDSSRRYLGPVITAYGDRWKKVFTAPSKATTIYQRTRALPPELR